MATDSPTPASCNKKIFRKGISVAVLDASSNAAETWVQAIAKKTKAKVDWHYSGGRAHVLHLGNEKSRQCVLKAMNEAVEELDGRILELDGPGCYRNTPPSIFSRMLNHRFSPLQLLKR